MSQTAVFELAGSADGALFLLFIGLVAADSGQTEINERSNDPSIFQRIISPTDKAHRRKSSSKQPGGKQTEKADSQKRLLLALAWSLSRPGVLH